MPFGWNIAADQGFLGKQRPQPKKKPASGGRFREIRDLVFKSGTAWRCCQTNAMSSLFSKEQKGLGGQKLAPFKEGGISVQLEVNS